MVISANEAHSNEQPIHLDDDDIDLCKDDNSYGTVDGIPTIDFFDRVQSLPIKIMDLTLIVKCGDQRHTPWRSGKTIKRSLQRSMHENSDSGGREAKNLH
ncbi:hypothetical protein GQ457_09G015310 [Hibiscus cannabinus]